MSLNRCNAYFYAILVFLGHCLGPQNRSKPNKMAPCWRQKSTMPSKVRLVPPPRCPMGAHARQNGPNMGTLEPQMTPNSGVCAHRCRKKGVGGMGEATKSYVHPSGRLCGLRGSARTPPPTEKKPTDKKLRVSNASFLIS